MSVPPVGVLLGVAPVVGVLWMVVLLLLLVVLLGGVV